MAYHKVMEKRCSINIDLSQDARVRLREAYGHFGMKQREALSRLVEWFADQERIVQTLVLGQIPDDYAGDIVSLLYAKRHPPEVGTAEKARDLLHRTSAAFPSRAQKRTRKSSGGA